MQPKLTRCWKTDNPLFIKYHDEEWGVPVHDDQKLFELLTLEGFQAGLTWELILKRREALKKAFLDFNPKAVANLSTIEMAKILSQPDVIKNRAKICATVNNAQKLLQTQKEFGSFDKYIWQFVNGKPINNTLKNMQDTPAETEESRAMSKELKRRGFKFVGPVICYAFMQAVGMVNDHLTFCFRYKEIHNGSNQTKPA